MKKTLFILALTTPVVTANPEDYVNFVRQIQQDSGVEWDVSVAPSGSMLSQEGVGPEGSLFQLWSVHRTTGYEFHLDEEFVSSFTPSASITIQTGDPYQHIPRTRVDQPFAVRIHIGGLVHGNSGGGGGGPAPAKAGTVLLSQKAGEYPEGEHSFEEAGTDNSGPGSTGEEYDPLRTVGSAFVSSNGSFVLNYPMTSLRGPDLTKVEGEEVWSVSALEGGEGGAPFTEGDILESTTLQVWPIADATISGIDPVARYETLPPVTVSLGDLYPDSTTHVRVYGGPPIASPNDPKDVQTSYVIIQDSIPQDRVLTLEGLDDYFPRAGAYTLEVVHQTPFGVEVLNRFYPINIQRTISVRGSVYSTE